MSTQQLDKRWWHNSVVYQIYPRSFNDANGDGIGDIPGIIDKLDYIAELGANVIWLSPVYQSPMDDNGYDISDYQKIAPEFGTMADMDRLIAEADKRGIKIVMDLVVNHTSDEHPWFIESRSSKDSPKRDWYIWKDPKPDGSEPNNWESFFKPKAWTLDENTGQYYLHLFSNKQPDLNWANPEVREAVYDMMHFWLKKGLGGFRMDVINMIGKPSDYPDATIFDQGVAGWEHWSNNLLVHQYLREMHDKVLKHYDVLTVGETPFTTTLDGRYYSHPDRNEISMIFQFEHVSIDREEHNAVKKPFDLVQYKEIMTRWQEDLYQKGWNSLYWSNHDQPRTVSRYGCDSAKYRVVSAKMLGTVLHMMSGTPYIYQGEEIGMTNKHFDSIDEFNDLMAKFHYQKMRDRGVSDADAVAFLNDFSRDHARVPVQWNDQLNAGFTSGTPWLPVNDNYSEINAEQAVNDDDSIYHHYRRLIALRQGEQYGDVIVYGEHQLLDPQDSEVYAYIRSHQGESLLTIANFSGNSVVRSYPGSVKQQVINNYPETVESLTEMALKPYQALVIELA
ncbi:glycoside hydrolase family 13 protein [Vibrio sp. 16]|uniref:glycoside hydrolase family 13 protein n=1 Tax=Vibrio sp. 16 TaxID=391586 RepID=UPI00018F1D12|nr:alpha-glucosidase [Vibrio sp. 16]EED28646.1 oligo-1,6-glucosidase [Vibrio sp. 16]CAK4074781.1 Oligo-1,6-glucosidase [Vibrio sp. 16]